MSQLHVQGTVVCKVVQHVCIVHLAQGVQQAPPVMWQHIHGADVRDTAPMVAGGLHQICDSIVHNMQRWVAELSSPLRFAELLQLHNPDQAVGTHVDALRSPANAQICNDNADSLPIPCRLHECSQDAPLTALHAVDNMQHIQQHT